MSVLVMNIIITGSKQIGKSTAAHNIYHTLKDKGYTVGGVITTGGRKRKLVLLSNEEELLFESTDYKSSIRVGRFFIDIKNLKKARNTIVESLSCDFLIIDEIGILEKDGRGFLPEVQICLTERKSNNIFVLRKEVLSWFLEQFKPLAKFKVFELQKKDSQTNAENIISILTDY